jgi:hypothetical protein
MPSLVRSSREPNVDDYQLGASHQASSRAIARESSPAETVWVLAYSTSGTRGAESSSGADEKRSLHADALTSADVRCDQQVAAGLVDGLVREVNALGDGCDTEVANRLDTGPHDGRSDPHDKAVD